MIRYTYKINTKVLCLIINQLHTNDILLPNSTDCTFIQGLFVIRSFGCARCVSSTHSGRVVLTAYALLYKLKVTTYHDHVQLLHTIHKLDIVKCARICCQHSSPSRVEIISQEFFLTKHTSSVSWFCLELSF